MKNINEKLALLQGKIENNSPIVITIIGLGSVGLYLLDYLLSLSDPQLRIVVVGRNSEKMLKDVNIVKTAATIRKQLQSKIFIESECDLDSIQTISEILKNINRILSLIVAVSIRDSSMEVYLGVNYVRTVYGHPSLCVMRKI